MAVNVGHRAFWLGAAALVTAPLVIVAGQTLLGMLILLGVVISWWWARLTHDVGGPRFWT